MGIISRRALLIAGAVSTAMPISALASQVAGPLEFPTPDSKNLRSGDLIWPKKKGAYVPYNSGDGSDYEADKLAWGAERDTYVKARSQEADLDAEDRRQLDMLAEMEFREFLAVYQADEVPGIPGLYGGREGGGIYVGHVGIIERDKQGMPWVVEALWEKGVVRKTYDDWLASRPNELVWHGRLKSVDAAGGEALVAEARKHVGKPYRFWNFDLNDDSGFYCSKLAWLSAYRSLGFAIDGKPKAKRGFWFSPKQLLYVPRIDRLHDPGKYGSA